MRFRERRSLGGASPGWREALIELRLCRNSKPWRVTNSGWLGSSWHSQRAPGAGVGPGGVDLRSPTPATRRCYPHLNQEISFLQELTDGPHERKFKVFPNHGGAT